MDIQENKKELGLSASIIMSGIIIAGSILIGFSWLKNGPSPKSNEAIKNVQNDIQALEKVPPISVNDKVLGNRNAKITIIEYADFQCPFCGRFHKDAGQTIKNDYVNKGLVSFVYRDFAFLGDESIKSAEAAKCADDQGKFWEYHDYLFTHQKGENQGNFSNKNLKSFASELGLNTTEFNKCLDSDKYKQAVLNETSAGSGGNIQICKVESTDIRKSYESSRNIEPKFRNARSLQRSS